jgi:hypothetical protein
MAIGHVLELQHVAHPHGAPQPEAMMMTMKTTKAHDAQRGVSWSGASRPSTCCAAREAPPAMMVGGGSAHAPRRHLGAGTFLKMVMPLVAAGAGSYRGMDAPHADVTRCAWRM